jgi:hypothetical protein
MVRGLVQMFLIGEAFLFLCFVFSFSSKSELWHGVQFMGDVEVASIDEEFKEDGADWGWGWVLIMINGAEEGDRGCIDHGTKQ